MADVSTLAPGALLDAQGSLVLTAKQWAAVQAYCVSAIALPAGMDEFKTYLPADPPGGFDAFEPLVGCWQDVHAHATTWRNDVFPASVSCAADIVHYADKVPLYYGALPTALAAILAEPSDPAALATFKALVGNLRLSAQGYAGHATLVKQGMVTFSEATQADQKRLAPLLTDYLKQLGDEDPVIAQMQKDYAADKAAVDMWNAQWEHDTIVAATSLAYAWIWPFGTVAAVIVAGIYGKRATDDLSQAAGYQEKTKILDGKLKSAAQLSLDLKRIDKDLQDVSDKLGAALAVIEAIEGRWTALDDDLANILSILDEDVSKADDFIKSLGIDEAIDAWRKIGAEADAYRQNAFITVTDDTAKAA
jgi:hypothetical protein